MSENIQQSKIKTSLGAMAASTKIFLTPDEIAEEIAKLGLKSPSTSFPENPLTSEEMLAVAQRLSLKTPSESVDIVRADRDGH